MKRINIFVEGQTEEVFVQKVLYEHFQPLNIFLTPILIRTGRKGKGGVSSYGKIRKQIYRKCHQDKKSFVSTMFDYYGLPNDFPGKNKLPNTDDPIKKVTYLENEFNKDISLPNFIPNFLVFEFEALLFTKTEAFGQWFETSVIEKLAQVRDKFSTPEHINDNPKTSPSKRIIKLCPSYKKIYHGTHIALDIGLDLIRKDCHHFNDWLNRLEKLN